MCAALEASSKGRGGEMGIISKRLLPALEIFAKPNEKWCFAVAKTHFS